MASSIADEDVSGLGIVRTRHNLRGHSTWVTREGPGTKNTRSVVDSGELGS